LTGILKVIGLMSGTSLDGVDAALLDTDGVRVAKPGPALTVPYDPETRALLRAALSDAPGLAPGASSAGIADAEARLTETHARAVKLLLSQAGLLASDIAFAGFHGQTILHRPEERRTWQIGNGASLARALGIAVVNDFRSADVAAGGQGAPFVPLYHAALTRNLDGSVVVVNIDGETLLAFDTGPGNAVLDDWAQVHTGKPVDQDGALARKGRVQECALAEMLAHPFFDRAPPKSLDRLDFSPAAVRHLSPEDGAATLTAFTAASIARAAEHFPNRPAQWIICGGGRHNPVLMRELEDRLSYVRAAEDAGWRGDFLEAEAFAYLAARSVRGLPLSLPSTTGVPTPMTGGTLHKPMM